MNGTRTTELREMLAQGQVVSLGAYDAMTARLAERCGAQSIYVSGYAAAAVQLGKPDLGLLSQTEMAAHIGRICSATRRPVFADADTGYGGVLNAQRTVELWEHVGAAGLHIEDQVFPKRCGHVAGKAVVPISEMVVKLRAAVAARRDQDFLIIARTDAIAVEGINGAIERCKRYCDAGVDGFFIDAPESIEQLEKISNELKPLERVLVFNCVRTMKSPILTVAELAGFGFNFVFYPIEAMLAAFKAVDQTYRNLMQGGSTNAVSNELASFADFNDFIGLADQLAVQNKFSA